MAISKYVVRLHGCTTLNRVRIYGMRQVITIKCKPTMFCWKITFCGWCNWWIVGVWPQHWCLFKGFRALKQFCQHYQWCTFLFVIFRLLWCFIVGSMTGYLMYGSAESIKHYFDRPVTSIVKINYVSHVPFPAVTFCNYNWWRKSIVPEEFHEAIRSLNPDRNNPVNASYLEAHGVTVSDLSDLLRRDGHQIEDMLLSCTFKGVDCTAINFTQSITDFGLCYSFNNDPDNVYNIHQSGSHNALFMKINIQQYEYIFGQNNAAGIKVNYNI